MAANPNFEINDTKKQQLQIMNEMCELLPLKLAKFHATLQKVN